MTNDILKRLEESLFIMLEANYDPEVLRCSSYPFSLKSRIAGPTGHLPNEMAGKTISHLLNSGLKTAMLGHLSKESNFPELAYQTVLDELISSNYDENSLQLSVASRDIHSKIIKL
jgi:phosphoribosyl 1,2-cyclic phosphodiesterase